MDADHRSTDLISFVKLGEVDIGFKLLVNCYILTHEVNICLSVRKARPPFSTDVHSGNGWVVTNLFCNIFKIVVFVFVCFSEQWVKRLGCGTLTNR